MEGFQSAVEAGASYSRLVLLRDVEGIPTRTQAALVMRRPGGILLGVPTQSFTDAELDAGNEAEGGELGANAEVEVNGQGIRRTPLTTVVPVLLVDLSEPGTLSGALSACGEIDPPWGEPADFAFQHDRWPHGPS